MIRLKSSREIQGLRDANQIVAEVLNEIEEAVRPGVSTQYLDDIAGRIAAKYKARCVFNGYRGFPANICASRNEEVVHGIPSRSKCLNEGDIISVDFGVIYGGWVGDAARTFPVGKISEEASRLIDATRGSLYKAIEKMYPGGHLGDIGEAVQSYVEAAGFSVVRDYVGHGIGREMHEEPQVLNYATTGRGHRLRSGLVLAIEPMINVGTWQVETLDDNWTVVTKDRKWSAHFEHSVAITENGPLILSEL